MTIKQQKQIIKTIEAILNASQKLRDEKVESHAFIVGYLEGGMKTVLNEIKSSSE